MLKWSIITSCPGSKLTVSNSSPIGLTIGYSCMVPSYINWLPEADIVSTFDVTFSKVKSSTNVYVLPCELEKENLGSV